MTTARVVISQLPHHVYLRGNNRRRLFSSDKDRWLMLRCLSRGLRLSGCRLHQLTFMTNHVHMVVTPPSDQALARFMHRSNQRYAQVRNAEHHGSGKLFEERFRSKPITDEEQLMMTTLYNDANAYRAGIVDEPLAHIWSTGPLHAGTRRSRIPRRMWTPSNWYLRLGAHAEARAIVYRWLMAAYLHPDAIRETAYACEVADLLRHNGRVQRPDGSSAR